MKHEWKANLAYLKFDFGKSLSITLFHSLAMKHRDDCIETARILYDSEDGHLLVEGYQYYKEFAGEVAIGTWGFPSYETIEITKEKLAELNEKYFIPPENIKRKKKGWFWNRREVILLESDQFIVKIPRPYSKEFFIKDTIIVNDKRYLIHE